MSETRETVIQELGSGGDGIAEQDGERIFIAGALPGERVEFTPEAAPVAASGGGRGKNAGKGRGAGRGRGRQRSTPTGGGTGGPKRGRLIRVVEASADRIEPACRHFGTCGGCVLQHLAPGALLDWKRAQVVGALSRRGFDPALLQHVVQPTVAGGPGRRRRTVLTVQRGRDRAGTIRLGYHRRGSHDLLDISECPVLEPELVTLATAMRRTLPSLLQPGDQARIAVNVTDAGLDVLVTVAAPAPDRLPPDLLMDLAEFAGELDLARIGLQFTDMDVPVAARRNPRLDWPGFAVAPPPGGFLQADRQIERWMQDRIAALAADMTPAAGRLQAVDLFAGCGTLCAALPGDTDVAAFDSAGDAISALQAGANAAQAPVEAVARNLDRHPVMDTELARFDMAVIDPPAAGARAQAEQLARSSVPLIAYISCAPGSFARDARTLVDGGYVLEQVTPLDQFHWSADVELLAVFRRPVD